MIAMKRWVIVDDCGVDIFTEVLSAETREQAIKQAELEWSRLSAFDKERRYAFFIGVADVDEDGIFDLGGIDEAFFIRDTEV